MRKSEYAYDQVQRHLAGRGPVALDTLIDQSWLFADDGDPRWIGVALSQMSRDGKVRYPVCDNNHNHGAECTVELIGA
jgi:hypothetical protein